MGALSLMKVDGIAAGRDETPLDEQGVSSGTTSRTIRMDGSYLETLSAATNFARTAAPVNDDRE